MSQLPIQHTPTIELLYKGYTDRAKDFRRPHLGASVIGKECPCALWYDFRWCSDPGFEARLLRLFESGYKEEDRIIENLRSVGITIYSRDPTSGEQLHFNEEKFGHFSGSVDGIGINFPEAPKTWHLIEIKTSSKKLYDKMVKEGVEKAKPQHYAQIQVYLRWAKLDRAFYIVCCKDDDRLYGERVYFDKDVADRLVEKARRVIYTPTPLEKLGESETSFCCKFCDHAGLCWHGSLPLVSCRSCAFSTPEVDGTWTCGRFEKNVISEFEQKRGCENHVFIPELVSLPLIGADPEIGKHAVTHYKVLERFGYVTLISCKLETGRTHQTPRTPGRPAANFGWRTQRAAGSFRSAAH